jgi:hypothetical protein
VHQSEHSSLVQLQEFGGVSAIASAIVCRSHPGCSRPTAGASATTSMSTAPRRRSGDEVFEDHASRVPASQTTFSARRG